jgi:hypothetical protein
MNIIIFATLLAVFEASYAAPTISNPLVPYGKKIGLSRSQTDGLTALGTVVGSVALRARLQSMRQKYRPLRRLQKTIKKEQRQGVRRPARELEPAAVAAGPPTTVRQPPLAQHEEIVAESVQGGLGVLQERVRELEAKFKKAQEAGTDTGAIEKALQVARTSLEFEQKFRE